jgi:hypothetical protein
MRYATSGSTALLAQTGLRIDRLPPWAHCRRPLSRPLGRARMFRAGCAGLLLLAVSAAGASAQSHTRGLFLQAHGNASTLRMATSDTSDMRTGIGFGIGSGFTPALAWFINVDAAANEGAAPAAAGPGIAHAELGGRYTFRDASARWRPSIDVSAAVMMAWWDELEVAGGEPVYMELAGFGFGVGGGLAYYFNPALALNMVVRMHTGSFDDHRIDNLTVHLEGKDRIRVTTSRFNLGVIWYPGGRQATRVVAAPWAIPVR